MNKDIQEETARLKREVLAEHGIDLKDTNLLHDVRRWVELIHEYLTSEELTVEWLQEQPGMSRKTTVRFCAENQVSTKAYITRLRVELVRKIIAKEDTTLMSVALRVGFRDHSTLTKAFIKHAGCLPSEITNEKNGKMGDKNSSIRD